MRLRSLAVGAGVLVAGFVALSVVVALGGLVFRGSGSDESGEPRRDPVTSSTSHASTTVVTSGGPTEADDRLGPSIEVRLGGTDDFAPPPPVVGGLRDGMVVSVTARGFPGDSDGRARQCGPDGSCGPSIPVRFDGGGRARFLFLLADDVPSGASCRGGTRCTLVVSGTGERRAVAVTGFGDATVATPEVAVVPRSGVTDGTVVRVQVSGVRPHASLSVLQCVAPDTSGPRRCGDPGPVLDATADERGAATVDFTVRAGRVGTEAGVTCDRRSTCGISVLVDGVAVARVVELAFSSGPTADYDARRLALGLALAAAFALVALLVGVRTRWRLAPDPFT